MPFKSEKQRRFLWAAHPDIAKRWAHEYPESNKGLPMYARKKKTEKEAALTAISRYVNKLNNLEGNLFTVQNPPISKNANSKQTYIEIPHSEKPTYAGEEKETAQQSEPNENSNETSVEMPKNKQQNAINALLKKVALVVAPGIKRLKEKQDAAAEGREPAYVPENQDVKHYPVATPGIMPPMGSQQQTAQAQPQQPQSRPSAPPVGNGSTPQSRPIQSFGGLDVNNKLTGNSGLAGGRNPGKALKQSSLLPMNNNLAQSQQNNNQPGLPQRIGNAINSLDRGTGLGWGTIGSMTTLPVTAAGYGYVQGLRHMAHNTVDTPEWQKLLTHVQTAHPELDVTNMQKMRRQNLRPARTLGQLISQPQMGPAQKKQLDALRNNPGFYASADLTQGRPMLAYNTKYKTPGILAHELGHHLGGKTLARMHTLGRFGSGLGTIGALAATNEDTSRNRAYAGTASFLPTMISEIDASRRGAKIMKNLKLPGRWKAFAGLPSYAIAASAPMMAHYGKKFFGGFTPNTPQQ